MTRATWHAFPTIGRVAAGAMVVALVALGIVVGGGFTTGPRPWAGASPAVTRCSERPAAGPKGLRLEMVSTPEGRVPTVAVCIDGEGPFRFVVSTGTAGSTVTPSLARSLHLNKAPGVPVRGVTCVTSAPRAKVRTWSMSGVRLDPQDVLIARFSGAGNNVKGVIGSDVLARFGAIRIDYKHRRLVLLGREGAAPAGNVYVLGQKTSRPPAPLANGVVEAGSLLRVFETPQGTIVAAPVVIAGHPEQLAVDTGFPSSGLDLATARVLKLKAGGATLPSSGIGCTGTVPTYSSGRWTLGGRSLPSSALAARAIAGSVNSGLQGVLGSNALRADGSVIVDYAGAHLWLAKG